VRTRITPVAIFSTFLVLAPQAWGQGWDAATQAQSWAKQDKDDSLTFLEGANRTLHTWSRDGGVLGSVPLVKLDEVPERWVMDPRNNAWVAQGTSMVQVDRNGRVVTSVRLPAEVGDVCWDPKGFVISYRTSEPYLEKRDFKGSLIWSFGTKPGSRGDGPAPQNRRPMVTDDQGNVLMADGPSLSLALFDGTTGHKIGETAFQLPGGQVAPSLEGFTLDRGPLVLWPGRNVVFAALKASQLPASARGQLQGQALVRYDLGTKQMAFLPTGLDEAHLLVGVLDSDAIFVKPSGGLMLVKVK
jgi:hypothetical protein